jgi:hypothetical protein
MMRRLNFEIKDGIKVMNHQNEIKQAIILSVIVMMITIASYILIEMDLSYITF